MASNKGKGYDMTVDEFLASLPSDIAAEIRLGSPRLALRVKETDRRPLRVDLVECRGEDGLVVLIRDVLPEGRIMPFQLLNGTHQLSLGLVVERRSLIGGCQRHWARRPRGMN